MTFEEAKAQQEIIQSKVDECSATLKEFDKFGKGNMGVTPDHIKAMPEWKQAFQNYHAAFNQLRNFNGWYVKTFKKELRAERANRFKKAAN